MRYVYYTSPDIVPEKGLDGSLLLICIAGSPAMFRGKLCSTEKARQDLHRQQWGRHPRLNRPQLLWSGLALVLRPYVLYVCIHHGVLRQRHNKCVSVSTESFVVSHTHGVLVARLYSSFEFRHHSIYDGPPGALVIDETKRNHEMVPTRTPSEGRKPSRVLCHNSCQDLDRFFGLVRVLILCEITKVVVNSGKLLAGFGASDYILPISCRSCLAFIPAICNDIASVDMYRVNQILSLQEVQEQSQTIDVRSQRSRLLGS